MIYHITRFMACLLLGAVAVAAHCADLAQFNQNNYEGWVYNRNGVVDLSTARISGNKVTVYRDASGVDYTLTSPELRAGGASAVNVEFTFISTSILGGDVTHYSMYRNSPYVVLLDSAGNALSSYKCMVTDTVVTRHLRATMQLPAGVRRFKIRVAACDADVNNAGAIRAATIAAVAGHAGRGDVNGDGGIDVSDVTTVTNYILGALAGFELDEVDVNADGRADVSDVTELINMILSAGS